ncbi:hypothetical protein Tco_1555632 [Tanacetum coccineum]
MASGSGADEGSVLHQGFRAPHDYDSEDDISWKINSHSDDDINTWKQEGKSDEVASFDPTIHAPSRISSSDDEFSDRSDGSESVILHRLKALEDNFSELGKQIIVEGNREESTTANQQFLDSIDEGMKKIIKEQVKKEVSKITPKIEKLVTDQLESEVLVRSSKEANTSHALPRDGADDDQEKKTLPLSCNRRGPKRRRSGKDQLLTGCSSETKTTIAGKTTTGSKTHKKSASQSAQAEEKSNSFLGLVSTTYHIPYPDLMHWNKLFMLFMKSGRTLAKAIGTNKTLESHSNELTDSNLTSPLL